MEATNTVAESMKQMEKEGIRFLEFYWTLGRYYTVVIIETPDEKTVMKANMRVNAAFSSN